MFKTIYKNLDKFEYSYLTSDIHYFQYNNVRIKIVFFGLGMYCHLYHNDTEVMLTMLDKLLLMLISEKLIKINRKKYKEMIKKELS